MPFPDPLLERVERALRDLDADLRARADLPYPERGRLLARKAALLDRWADLKEAAELDAPNAPPARETRAAAGRP